MSTDETTFDPLLDERLAGGVALPRNPKNDNPLIVPRGETEELEYTRASSLASFLVRNVHRLKQWEMRYLAPGVARHPDLAAMLAPLRYSTGPITGTQPISKRQQVAREIDEIIEMVLEREGIHEAANVGTAVHAATEPGSTVDLGVMEAIAPEAAKAIRNYHLITAGLERVASEVFVVCDEAKAAGTFDSGYLSPEFPGQVVVGDTKNGKSVHIGEFEVQMAIYARGEIYLPGEGRLTHEEFFGVPMNLDIGYLVHVPLLDSPKPRIIKLDLQRGWRRALLCAQIRDESKAMDSTPMPEKYDHDGWAKKVLDAELAKLVALTDESDPGYIGATEFRERALELRRRFQHIWQDSHTMIVKGRLT
jgi:hypothetical protein